MMSFLSKVILLAKGGSPNASFPLCLEGSFILYNTKLGVDLGKVNMKQQ